jgi:predicted permease
MLPESINGLWLRIKALFRRRQLERDLDDELAFHLAMRERKLAESGVTPEEAPHAARRKFGNATRAKEANRELWTFPFAEALWQDIRYGLRQLRRNPGFTIVATVTLALGIGVNVSMLGVVDSLMFRLPAHVHAPGQLIEAGLVTKQQPDQRPTISYRQYQRLATNAHLAEWAFQGLRRSVGFGQGAAARPISVSYVSHTYLHVLGAHMPLGRWFNAEEDQPTGSPRVVVLGYSLWQRAFGGDPKILGRMVPIGGEERRVVGVAPEGFTGTAFLKVDAWLPIHAFHEFPLAEVTWTAVGRLRKGATVQQAAAEATILLRHGRALNNQVVRVEPLFSSRWKALSPNDRISLWIAGVALIVLLIACTNVSSLLLARVAQRRHEMAIRQHLGATRARVMRQVLIEGLLLGAAGGAAALLVALAAQPLVGAFLLPRGFYAGSFLNWRLLALATGLAICAGCASALAPAWRASEPRVAEVLKSGERGHTREGSGLRWSLVVIQTGLALLLAVGAGLFIRSLRKVDAIDLGFQPKGLLQATVALPLGPAMKGSTEANTAYERLRSRAEHVPGVAEVALANMLTIETDFTIRVTSRSGKTLLQWTAMPRAVTPNYFSTMRTRILEGRPLLDSDTEGSAPVVVVNQSMAREVWPEQNPLGKCLRTSLKTTCARVVGVVPDALLSIPGTGPGPTTPAEFYVPLSQAARQGTLFPSPDGLLIRTKARSPAVVANLFAALESVSPGGRYVSIEPYTKMLDEQTRSWRLGASMLSLFGGLALMLAAVGIYGVLAFLVRQRTAEIGVRIALGATPRDVLRMVIAEGMKFAAIGVVIGVAVALALTRLMKGLLYGVSVVDPATFVGAVMVLGLVAALACGLAAWRAARVDPVRALKYE